MLGRAVGAAAGRAAPAADGAEHDDGASAAGAEVREEGAGYVDRAEDIGVKLGNPMLVAVKWPSAEGQNSLGGRFGRPDGMR